MVHLAAGFAPGQGIDLNGKEAPAVGAKLLALLQQEDPTAKEKPAYNLLQEGVDYRIIVSDHLIPTTFMSTRAMFYFDFFESQGYHVMIQNGPTLVFRRDETVDASAS